MGSTLSNVAIDIESPTDSPSSGVIPITLPESSSAENGVSIEYAKDPNKQWYVLRATYGRERKAYNHIIAHGSIAYLPIRKKRIIKDGKEETFEQPLVANLLFIYATEDEVYEFVRGHHRLHYLNYYYNHLKKDERGYDKKMVITDYEMNNFIRVTNADNENIQIVTEEQCHFKSGDLVLVKEGKFAGVTGKVARVLGQQRVIVKMEGVCCVATAYIPKSFLTFIN